MFEIRHGGARQAALRFSVLLFAISLIYTGLSDLYSRSWASSADEEEVDYPEIYDDVGRALLRYYLDQDRIAPKARRLVEKALTMVENMVEEIWVEYPDRDMPVVHVGDRSRSIALSRVTSLQSAIGVLKDITDFIKAHYHGKRSINDIRYYAVNGFLSGLDPHTQVFNPKGFRDFSVHIEGEIYGVGMYVWAPKGVLTVRKVLKGTPAERAGFKNGDKIVKIGDESTVNMDVDEAVKKIRGPEHSKVVLTVKRKKKESDEIATLPIEVERERVTIPSVVDKLLDLEGGGKIGYVGVNNFDKNTVPSLKDSLDRLKKENGGEELGGLILDLRENSGGLLQQASDMADLFLAKGELYWIAQRGQEEEKEARPDRRDPEPNYPIIVLGNERSASGAEIVIGALQKNDRAIVLGTPTFGKGSVQQLHPLRHEWQLKITVSEYLIPGKISIQENGVVPDILAERAIVSDRGVNIFPDSRFGTERDYDDHIVSRYAKDEKPAERIQYLVEIDDPDEEDLDNPEGTAAIGEIEPTKDTLVKIGMKLLDQALDTKVPSEPFRARSFLEKHRADIEKIRREAFAKIVTKLEALGIDWKEGPNPESPSIELTVEHERIEKPSKDEDNPIPKPFLVLTARATNRSDQPVYRIKAITGSDYLLYREYELLFGRIEPGATVERKAEIEIPYYPAARNDLIKLSVSGPSGKTILEREHEVVLTPPPRPAFAYSATLLDKEKKTPIEALAPGEEAIFKLKVINCGKGPSHKGIAILRNTTGPEVFLESGRIEFKDLAPGGETEVEFSFRTTEGSTKKKYDFELGMADQYSNETLTREVVIPAEGGDGPPFPNGKRFQPPGIDAVLSDPSLMASTAPPPVPAAGPLLVTDLAEVELTATVTGSEVPFQAWVTCSPIARREEDPDKLHFEESKGTDPLRFGTRVPLKKGTTVIHVSSSDENGLQSRKILVIRRR